MWIQDSILPVLLLFPPFLAAQTQCYLPDGSKAGSQYQPCNSVPNASSMCCDTSAGDQCQPNGLCKGFPDNTPQLWRDSCTDQSWRSPFCLQLCVNGVGSIKAVPDGTTVYYAQNDVPVKQCSDGSYCCGWGNSTCCEQGGVHIAETVGVSTSATTILPSVTPNIASTPASSISLLTTISTTTTASATGSPTVSNAAPGGTTANPSSSTIAPLSPINQTTNSPSSNGLSASQSVGIGVGTGLGVIALVLAGGAIWWFLVKKNKRPRGQARSPFSMKEGFYGKGPRAAEMEAAARRQELHGAEFAAELPPNYKGYDRA